ncbi:MAG TPA: formate dehydrogenase accessory sulfurtransferase FdhD [Candidatus Deferrimicrobium sp.]|nr:formate dehydrogenase accessory sulfurtransferase FdhD [Candidatus Deferrimicrobium sp.]
MKESIFKIITRYSQGAFHEIEDEIAVETIITIWVNEKLISSILCSPFLEKELVIGYLYTTGIIGSFQEVEDILQEGYDFKIRLNPQIDLNTRLKNSQFINRVINTGCGPPEYWLQVKKGKGLPQIESKIQIQVDEIFKAIKDLNTNSKFFRQTGATHAAGLYELPINRIIVAEDIGRHNAVDKVIGHAIIHGIAMDNKLLTSTGRLTADIIFKSSRCKIPIIASMAAATDSGISSAKATNTTLIGFVRGRRLNIYTNPFRITTSN